MPGGVAAGRALPTGPAASPSCRPLSVRARLRDVPGGRRPKTAPDGPPTVPDGRPCPTVGSGSALSGARGGVSDGPSVPTVRSYPPTQRRDSPQALRVQRDLARQLLRPQTDRRDRRTVETPPLGPVRAVLARRTVIHQPSGSSADRRTHREGDASGGDSVPRWTAPRTPRTWPTSPDAGSFGGFGGAFGASPQRWAGGAGIGSMFATPPPARGERLPCDASPTLRPLRASAKNRASRGRKS